MKYFIGAINNYFGEPELTTYVKFSTNGSPEDYLNRLAREFWGEPIDEEDGRFDYGDMSCTAGGYQQVDPEVFDAIKIIPHLRLNVGE